MDVTVLYLFCYHLKQQILCSHRDIFSVALITKVWVFCLLTGYLSIYFLPINFYPWICSHILSKPI